VAAVDKVLKDESFHLLSSCATATISAARVVSAWIKENNNKFEKDLVSSLTNCLEQPKVKSATNREKMWRAYHQLRTSGGYIEKWEEFLQAAGVTGKCNIFFQTTGDYMFKELIKVHHPLNKQEGSSSSSSTSRHQLTYMEMNAVRYAAGYIPRSLKKKLMKSTNPLKDNLLLCLMQLIDEEDDEPTVDDSKDWLEKIDRGGLIKVKNDTLEVFMEMEYCLRSQIAKTSIPSFGDNIKEEIISSRDISFVWSLLSSECEEKTSNELLKNDCYRMGENSWFSLCYWVDRAI